MNAKRISAALLAALMLVSASACGESGTSEKITVPAVTDSGEITAPAETTEDPNAPLDAVPEVTFGGAHFRTIQQETTLPFTVEEETGEIVNDTLFARNRGAEERFEVVIDPVRLEN